MRFSNCKLNYKIIDKLMLQTTYIKNDMGELIESNNITSSELDLLIYMSTKQDAFGNVSGIYYKDVVLDLCLKSKQTFYNALYGLENKEYIKINYNRKDEYWECTILNNVFSNSKDDKKGYFNTNLYFLHTQEFRSLSLNEKKLCIKLAIVYKIEKCQNTGLRIYPSKMAKWLGIKSTSLIYGYIENIKEFFPNTVKTAIWGNIICFEKNISTSEVNCIKSEKEHYLMHKLIYFCRNYRINYTTKDLKDLIVLISQYAARGPGKLFSTICNILLSKKCVEPALINSVLSGKDA